MDYTKLNDDIWCEIISYLNLKDIYNLENSDDSFKHLLERTRFWERKIKAEFTDEMVGQEGYKIARKYYWNLFLLRHNCNICNLCFIEDICQNIPECTRCNWLDML